MFVCVNLTCMCTGLPVHLSEATTQVTVEAQGMKINYICRSNFVVIGDARALQVPSGCTRGVSRSPGL